MRSRNKVLSSEVKTLKTQMVTLVEKGRHDDELIDALMVCRQGALRAETPQRLPTVKSCLWDAASQSA